MIKIGIYGNVNAGKSSLLNYIIGQAVSIVSNVSGTTTDVVRKRFELPCIGDVLLLDTAGLDDEGELGHERIKKTIETLEEIDLAIIIDDEKGVNESLFNDVITYRLQKGTFPDRETLFSDIKNILPKQLLTDGKFYGELLKKGETVLLVCPIDNGAPEVRLILPQVQAIRAALDLGARSIVVQVEELESTLSECKVDLVVTDSQAFDQVTEIVSNFNKQQNRTLNLTSFSILLADLKGDITVYQKGLEKLSLLKPCDKILIIEYCSHHPSCDDIGHVKIPTLLDKYVGGSCQYTFITGRNPLPSNLSEYSLAIQCGGCMTNREQIIKRIGKLSQANVATTNYGLILRILLTFRKS